MGLELKNAFALFKYNFKGILLFELLFKLMSWMIYTPILLLLFRLSVYMSGYGFITVENFMSYLLRPSTLIIIFLLLGFFTLLLFCEISGLVYAFHASYHRVKISWFDLFYLSLKSLFKLIKTNLVIALIAVMGILMFYFNIRGSYFPKLTLTGVVNDYIVSNRLWMILFLIVGVLFSIGCVRWMYCPHWYNLSDLSLSSSIQASVKMTHHRFLNSVVRVILWYATVIVSVLLLETVGFGMMALLTETLNQFSIWIFTVKIIVFMSLILLMTIFLIPAQYCQISASYYHWLHEKRIGVPGWRNINLDSSKKVMSIFILWCFCFIGAGLMMGSNIYKDTFETLSLIRQTEITAHRGYSAMAPENTMPAIGLAIEHGADYIEVDVQKTKDEVLVLFHDRTLKRMAGIKKKISDLTYDELSTIDLGASFDDIFEGTHIATLEKALELCAGRAKLNIELKSSEEDLGRLVVDMVASHDMLEDIVITAADYEAIKRVKEYNNEIMTGYITSALYGDVSEMKYADVFSLQSSFITADLVADIHRHGKLVFAWTVNNLNETKRLMELGVDNIITDYVEHTLEVKASLIKAE